MQTSHARVAFSRHYLTRLCQTIEELDDQEIAEVIKTLENAWGERKQVFIAGNGGSAATASHMANDFMKTVTSSAPDQKGFRAICLSDNTPVLTAIANDIGYRDIFAYQLRTLAQPEDVLIVITGSGNSPNILCAIETAKHMNLHTVGILGKGGGKAGTVVDQSIIVPSNAYGPIEDIHMVLDHLITEYFKEWILRKSMGQMEPEKAV